MSVDYLLIGQGIAGSTLAVRLLQAGQSIMVLDDPSVSRSSRVAAGLFNPVVFRKLTLGWRAREALAEAGLFYTQLEQLTGASFFHPTGMYRVHGSTDEARAWEVCRQQAGFADLLGAPEPAELRPWLNQPFGGAQVNGAGYVDTGSMLQAVATYLKTREALQETLFDPQQLVVTGTGIRYGDVSARNIIFCEGYMGERNPWFGALPFNPAKGEVLIIRCPKLLQEPFNGGVFGVPVGNGLFRVGSTYAWHQADAEPTAEKRNHLEERLRRLLTVPFEVVKHEAGIRPTVRDRRPFAGLHPLYPQLGIFNGLGTKGVLLAPLLSKEVAAHLTAGATLPPDYSIERFHRRLAAAQKAR